jgi:osmotically-inducible protein OsmY
MKFSRFLLPVIGVMFLVTGAAAVAADATSDSALAEAVKAKLVAKDPEFLRAGEVEVNGGVVTLKGHVLTPVALARALQVSSTVPGVVRVVNRAVLRQ